MKTHIKKDDTVQVLSGEARGTKGRVIQVDRKNNRALVEGVNIVSRHTKPTAANPQGGIVKKEAPIHISNLLVVDPSTGKGARVGRKKDAKGNTIRYFKKSGGEIK